MGHAQSLQARYPASLSRAASAFHLSGRSEARRRSVPPVGGPEVPGGSGRPKPPQRQSRGGLIEPPSSPNARRMAQTFLREIGDLYSKTGLRPVSNTRWSVASRTQFSVYFIGKTPKRYPKGSVNNPLRPSWGVGKRAPGKPGIGKTSSSLPQTGKGQTWRQCLFIPGYLKRRQSRQAQLAA